MPNFFAFSLGPFSLDDFRREAGIIRSAADESRDRGTFLGFAEITIGVQDSHLLSFDTEK